MLVWILSKFERVYKLKHEKPEVTITLKDISGEKIDVFVKEYQLDESVSVDNVGDLKDDLEDGVKVGTVNIIYPFAGYNVPLTLDLIKGFHEEFGIPCAYAKIPFIDEKLFKCEIDFEKFHQIDYEEWVEAQEELTMCHCGGVITPMYDEHPYWITFCSKCDARHEDTEYSPIIEPA